MRPRQRSQALAPSLVPRLATKLLLALVCSLVLGSGAPAALAQTNGGAQPGAEIPLEALPDLPLPKPARKPAKVKKPAAPKLKTAPAPWLSHKAKPAETRPALEATPLPARPTSPLIAAPPDSKKPGPGATPNAAPTGTAAEVPPPPLVPSQEKPISPADSAPPLLKLSTAIGVVVLPGLSSLPAAEAARVELGLRAIAGLAPLSQHPILLAHPKTPCEEDACLADLGAAQQVDEVLAATFVRSGPSLSLRVRVVDVGPRTKIGEAQAANVVGDLDDQTAAAEALACKLLVPAGCFGEASIDADSAGTQLTVDGAPLPRGTRRKLAVGQHAVTARLGSRTAEGTLPVLHESPVGPMLTARLVAQELRLLSPAATGERPAPALAMVGEPDSPAPGSHSSAPRIAGVVAAAAGLVVGIAAAVEGAHSKTQISQAETAYNQHGGAYYQSDLAALQSGNSAARSANVLFAISGVLLAGGLVLTFAF